MKTEREGCSCPGWRAEAGKVEYDPKLRCYYTEGCCGQCTVTDGMIFCPWCGKRLPGTDEIKNMPTPPSAITEQGTKRR